jgi:hypothetical protein
MRQNLSPKALENERARDRVRGNRPPACYCKEWRAANPKKYKAHNAVNNALRDNRLFKEPCCVCGCTKVVGHHMDYNNPLDVTWMCQAHHKQWHEVHGHGLNG